MFEVALRALMRWTTLGRGLSATIVVLGPVVRITILALLLLVPLAKTRSWDAKGKAAEMRTNRGASALGSDDEEPEPDPS